jgi:hypothetical protein
MRLLRSERQPRSGNVDDSLFPLVIPLLVARGNRPLDPVHGKAILRSVAGVFTGRPQNQFGIF